MTHRLIVIFVLLGVLFSRAWAQETLSNTSLKDTNENNNQVVVNDVKLKNPFLSPFFKLSQSGSGKVIVSGQAKPNHLKPVKIVVKPSVVDVSTIKSKLKLNGLVWGGQKPQAIINGQIVSKGDFIEKARVESITQKGVQLLYETVRILLTVD